MDIGDLVSVPTHAMIFVDILFHVNFYIFERRIRGIVDKVTVSTGSHVLPSCLVSSLVSKGE